MNRYELSEYNAIKKWEKTEPSVVDKVTGFVTKPLVWLTEKIIPQKAIQGALNILRSSASLLVDTADIKRDGKVSSIKELQSKDLELSDSLANSVHNWANGMAGAEGAAAGYFGVFGMAADIPAIIMLAFRTIQKIGICYGFETKNEEDIMFVYHIMSVAGSNTLKGKTAALVLIKQMNVMIAKQTWKKMAEKAATNKYSLEALIIAIRSLSKSLSKNLTKRKALQTIPLVGGAVGATMNLAFINDIAWAARRCYQQRWLMLNEKIEAK